MPASLSNRPPSNPRPEARGARPPRGRAARLGLNLARVLALVVLGYFVLRAAAQVVLLMAEPRLIRSSDWGGPSVAGVMAVHCGPGVVAVPLIVLIVLHWRRSR